jgi:hypothetical protein
LWFGHPLVAQDHLYKAPLSSWPASEPAIDANTRRAAFAWIPASRAGMTERRAGMTERWAGMTVVVPLRIL